MKKMWILCSAVLLMTAGGAEALADTAEGKGKAGVQPDAALVKELLVILEETKSREIFLLTAAILSNLEAPKEVAIPAIIRGAERLRLMRGAISEGRPMDEHPVGMLIRNVLERSRSAEAGLTLPSGGSVGLLGAVAGASIGSSIGSHKAEAVHVASTNSEKPSRCGQGRLAATWVSRVADSVDSYNGGAKLRGIVGRVYLFDGGQAVAGDGELTVDIYDDRAVHRGGKARHLEQWRFPAEVLPQLQRKDAVGWGYSVFLPWSTIAPDITVVRLRVCFTPKGEPPLVIESRSVTLHHGDIADNVKPAKCQPVVERGLTLPTGHYLRHAPQYIPASTDGGPNAPPQK